MAARSPSLPHLSTLLQGRLPPSHLRQIHAHIIVSGAHQDNLTATRLIGLYPHHLALLVLRQLDSPNIFPFNAAIRVLAEHGHPAQAFSLLAALRWRRLYPNDFTFCFLLKGFSRLSDPGLVRQVHNQIVKSGFMGDVYVCNGLVSVYAKGVRDLGDAYKVFDEMPEREKGVVCCWSALISGCAKAGENEGALGMFLKMVDQELSPDSDTMVSVLSACANLDVECVHRWIEHLEGVSGSCRGGVGSDQINLVIAYLYGKLGDVEKSRAWFDKVGDVGKRSVVSWNVVINGYVQNGCASEALLIFRVMMGYGYVQPNHVTMVSVLSACAQIGDIDCGVWVHDYIRSKGRSFAMNTMLATALIDMYCKCGDLRGAEEVFSRMASKDVVSVNAMIMGFAVNGRGDKALHLFYRISELELEPNGGTFLGVLYACCHSGMLETGRRIFQAMKGNAFVRPQLEHYACYIDLLARSGCIEEALEIAETMPMEPNNYVWGALLGGCLLHSRTDLAREISKNLVEVDPESSGGYVMLSNALAFGREWGGVHGLRGSMRDKGVKKHPGCSWIGINGVVHQFLAGLSSHPDLEKISFVLDGLEKEMKISNA